MTLRLSKILQLSMTFMNTHLLVSFLTIGAGAFLLQPAFAHRSDKIRVELEGEIAAKCGLSTNSVGERTLYIADLLKAATYKVHYGVNCNTPFQYTIQSQNGALALEGGTAPEGAITRLPYDVGVRIPTDGGVIDDRCSSDSIAEGRATCALHDLGAAAAMDARATVAVTLPQAKEPGAVSAGRYVDRLTLVVSARP